MNHAKQGQGRALYMLLSLAPAPRTSYPQSMLKAIMQSIGPAPIGAIPTGCVGGQTHAIKQPSSTFGLRDLQTSTLEVLCHSCPCDKINEIVLCDKCTK